MPNVFCRTTKISNAIGRSEYISDKTHKQEEVLVHEVSMKYDLQFYHEYELTHQHQEGQRQNEAREIMLPLPNELASKIKGATTEEQKEVIKGICDELVREIVGEKHDYEYAVHWNHSRTNLHCHVLFSEREVVDLSQLEQKTYSKDIWQDPETHKLTKKGVGELVHRKGDLMFKDGQPVYKTDPLTAKDTRFKAKGFMVERDLAYQKVMDRHGYEFDINDSKSPYLAQKKLFQGASQDYIEMAKDWNREVKRYNDGVKQHIKVEPQMEMEYISIKRDILDNVREANRAERKITPKAVEMVKSMAAFVQRTVQAIAYKVENSLEHLSNWWQSNRENLMNINTAKHTLQDQRELLGNVQAVEEERIGQLERELEQAKALKAREEAITGDMKEYGFNRENAERILPQKAGVKAFVAEITEELQRFQEKYDLPVTERQRLIGIVFDEPEKIVKWIDKVYEPDMYFDIKPIRDKLNELHGKSLDMPHLEKPYERSYDWGPSL